MFYKFVKKNHIVINAKYITIIKFKEQKIGILNNITFDLPLKHE